MIQSLYLAIGTVLHRGSCFLLDRKLGGRMDISANLSQIFMDVFHIQDIDEVTTLAYRQKGWDSTTHMILVAKVEEAFSIMFEPDDVFSFKSFEKGVQLISNHLNR